MTFDYRTARKEEVLRRAAALGGMTLGQVINAALVPVRVNAANKGSVGAIIEAFFGISSDGASRPDFATAGIELKVVPVVIRKGAEPRSKERTSVSMIDFHRLAKEEWDGASVKPKIASILFVFYQHDFGKDRLTWPVLGLRLWHPLIDVSLEQTIRNDWTRVRDRVRRGEAHLLSEGDSEILGAATKGPGGADSVVSPNTDPPMQARRRAWALKPSLTSTLYRELLKGEAAFSRLALQDAKSGISLDELILSGLKDFEGRRLDAVGREMGFSPGDGKSGSAMLVRKVLGMSDVKKPIRELEATGLTTRILSVSPSGRPYEATSFPAFDHFELLEEEWEDSDLRSRLERILFIPLIRSTRKSRQSEARFGRFFVWVPDDKTLESIRVEWEMFREQIRNGSADLLPSASSTRFIHVRPHGRDSDDRVWAPNGSGGRKKVQKQSFWLNQDLTERLYKNSGGSV
jgi:DNA mismatch repair protein MutH